MSFSYLVNLVVFQTLTRPSHSHSGGRLPSLRPQRVGNAPTAEPAREESEQRERERERAAMAMAADILACMSSAIMQTPFRTWTAGFGF